MKSNYVGRRVKSKNIAELMKEKLKSKDEVVNQKLKDMINEESKGDESSGEADFDSSDKDSEYEYGDYVRKLFHG